MYFIEYTPKGKDFTNESSKVKTLEEAYRLMFIFADSNPKLFKIIPIELEIREKI